MPGFGLTEPSPLDSVAHVIQVALTPIFLLSGIAALLNVFSTRLARVADRVDLVSQLIEKSGHEPSQPLSAQLTYLRHRSHALDVAVVLGAFAGVATCAATLVLFIGAEGLRIRWGVDSTSLLERCGRPLRRRLQRRRGHTRLFLRHQAADVAGDTQSVL